MLRILQRLTSASVSRAITYSARRQPSLRLYLQRASVRNQSTIGAAIGCGRARGIADTATNISMAESEQQPQSQEALETESSHTETVEASEEDKRNKELTDAASQDENQQEGGGLVTTEDGGGTGEGGKEEGSSGDVDSTKTAAELEAEMNVDTTGAASGEATTTTVDKEKTDAADKHRFPEQPPKEENDKTPPPEEKDADGPKEHDQRSSAAAENNPPKQKEGGGGGGGWIRGFFNAPINLLRRGISLESGPRKDRQYYENLSLEEKRKLYTCGHGYLTLDEIETWEEFRKKQKPSKQKPVQPDYAPNQVLNEKVSLWRGDITKLEIGAIVNAANSSLLGGGGVDGAIHRAAGYSLKDECATLNGCDTGDAKLTSGHRLPAKYVLHTVGPINGSESKLRSCYERCLQLVLENNIRSVAFCCIATGVYGYPNDEAAHIALETTRKWLESHVDEVDRIIFCVFLKIDYNIYSQLLQYYFPPEKPEGGEGVKDGQKGEEGPMEIQDRGLPSTSARDAKEPAAAGEKEQLPSKSDIDEEFEVLDAPPTLQKSITEPVQRVPPSDSKLEETTKSQDPQPSTLDSNSDQLVGDEAAAANETNAAGATTKEEGVEEMDVVKNDESPSNKRPKLGEDGATASGEEEKEENKMEH